jgi:hypothetical protein
LEAFRGSGLVKIVIPASVTFLGLNSFSKCKSLFLITFESGSTLVGIEKKGLHQAEWFDEVVQAS